MDESQTKSESRATCGIDVIGLDLPHNLIGNTIFRCSKEAAGTNVQKLLLVELPSPSWGLGLLVRVIKYGEYCF